MFSKKKHILAFLIKNLGKINKGKKLEISWNTEMYELELIKKNSGHCLSYQEYKSPVVSIKVKDFKTLVTIPENGFYQVLVRKMDKKKNNQRVFTNLTVSEVF